MIEMDARTKAIGIITGGRVQALEDAGENGVFKYCPNCGAKMEGGIA